MAVKSGVLLATAFHPELTADNRWWVSCTRAPRALEAACTQAPHKASCFFLPRLQFPRHLRNGGGCVCVRCVTSPHSLNSDAQPFYTTTTNTSRRHQLFVEMVRAHAGEQAAEDEAAQQAAASTLPGRVPYRPLDLPVYGQQSHTALA